MRVIPMDILDIEISIENFDTVDRIRGRLGIIGTHDGYTILFDSIAVGL
jgi:hypothetical protein